MTSPVAAPHVLVVDDDRAFRHAIATLLQKTGYATAQAGDGVDALAQLRQAHVDLVLLDIGLPGMSGLDVLAEARRLPAPPRIVIITSDDTPGALLASFREQAIHQSIHELHHGRKFTVAGGRHPQGEG